MYRRAQTPVLLDGNPFGALPRSPACWKPADRYVAPPSGYGGWSRQSVSSFSPLRPPDQHSSRVAPSGRRAPFIRSALSLGDRPRSPPSIGRAPCTTCPVTSPRPRVPRRSFRPLKSARRLGHAPLGRGRGAALSPEAPVLPCSVAAHLRLGGRAAARRGGDGRVSASPTPRSHLPPSARGSGPLRAVGCDDRDAALRRGRAPFAIALGSPRRPGDRARAAVGRSSGHWDRARGHGE